MIKISFLYKKMLNQLQIIFFFDTIITQIICIAEMREPGRWPFIIPRCVRRLNFIPPKYF